MVIGIEFPSSAYSARISIALEVGYVNPHNYRAWSLVQRVARSPCRLVSNLVGTNGSHPPGNDKPTGPLFRFPYRVNGNGGTVGKLEEGAETRAGRSGNRPRFHYPARSTSERD